MRRSIAAGQWEDEGPAVGNGAPVDAYIGGSMDMRPFVTRNAKGDLSRPKPTPEAKSWQDYTRARWKASGR